MKLSILMSIGDSAQARPSVALVPAALLLLGRLAGSFLEAASVTGAFSGYRVTGLNGSAQFNLVAGLTGMDIALTSLQTTPVPEPATALQWLLRGAALSRRHLLRRRPV